jgi:hypothetical protein
MPHLLVDSTSKPLFAHFVLIINGRRMFRCMFSEPDRDKVYPWMEGYLHGLGNPDIQFDEVHDTDTGLFDTLIW